MQTRITKQGDVVVVHLIGRLDVETSEPFRHNFLRRLIQEKVIFNFGELSFVGSSGIIPFLETMKSFAENNQNGFKFCGVGSEFKKLFAASPLAAVEIFENENQAANAFALGQCGPAKLTKAAWDEPIQENASGSDLDLDPVQVANDDPSETDGFDKD